MANPIDPCRSTLKLENEKFREADSGGTCVAVCIEEGDVNIGAVSVEGEYNATPPTLPNGGTDSLQLDKNGRLITTEPCDKLLNNGAVTVGLTEVEAKVGASPETGRRFITIYNGSDDLIYYGVSGVSASIGTPIFKKQLVRLPSPEVGGAIYLISPTAGNDVIVSEYGL